MSYVGRCAAVSQVMSTLVELAKSQIGRGNCIKCVVAEDGIHSDMFLCSAHLLRNLDIEHPVYNVINSVVQSHHKAHGNCCKTLLVMAGLWFQEMEQLVEQLGLSIGEMSAVFESGLEASVDHLLCSSAIRLLNDDLSETSAKTFVEEAAHGCSASPEGDREEISSCQENKVPTVPSNSVGCVEKSDSNGVDRRALAEDEDVGWFFEEELNDSHVYDDYDCEKTVLPGRTKSNPAMHCTNVNAQDGELLCGSDNLAERLSNNRLCSDPNVVSPFRCLEMEDEFEDCFADAVFGVRESDTGPIESETGSIESESGSSISNSNQTMSQMLSHAEKRISGHDISNRNSSNLVSLNKEDLDSEMLHRKVDSNSKLTQELYSQCDSTRNTTSYSSDCHVLCEDKTQDLLDCENAAMFQIVHSDWVENGIHPTSNTIFDEAKHLCSKCVLNADSPECHCANGTCVSVEPDCRILAEDSAVITSNCFPVSAEGEPVHTLSFNFYNKYSRHSSLISNRKESEERRKTERKENSDDELISSQNAALGLYVNSSASDFQEDFECKSLTVSDGNGCISDDCDVLPAVETNKSERRVGSDFSEHSNAFRSEKQDLSLGNVTLCDKAVGRDEVKTSDSWGLLNSRSYCDHETSFYDVIRDNETEKAICEGQMGETVFGERLATLGSKLNHGADDMMKLVIKIAFQQLKDNASTRFERDLIHTCCLDGVAEDKTCIVEGLLIPITVDQIPLIVGEHEKPRRALLLNGDLVATFCHQGYRKVTRVSRICKTVLETESRSEIWLSQVMKVVEELDVGIVFVKGRVDENVMYRCLHRNVIVFEGVSYTALSALSFCTSAPLNLYIGDCTECCVAQGVELRLWTCEWVKKREAVKHLSYVTVNVPLSPLPVQTAVVCHPVESVTHVKEEQLLHCAHRLYSTLTSRKVLVGGGAAETVCALFLEQLTDDLERVSCCDTDLVTSTIYRAIARGLRRFVNIVLHTLDDSTVSSDSAPPQTVYDDCHSKLEAWRTASCLAILLLRCDMEIVARTSRSSQDSVIGYL